MDESVAHPEMSESAGLNASQVSPDNVKMRYASGVGPTVKHFVRRLPDGYSNYAVDYGGKRITLGVHFKDNINFDGNFKYPVYFMNPRKKWELVSLLKNKPEVFKALGKAMKKEFSAETAATRGMMGGYEPQAY
jgi:hypothetical protein